MLLRTAGTDISRFTKYPIYKQFIRKALRRSEVVVTESLWERERLYNLCNIRTMPEVIVIGVETTLFRPPISRDNLRDMYGLPRDAFIVISNRYLEGCYNGWSIVEAIKSILDMCPDLVLFYVSPWPVSIRLKAKIQAMAAQVPRVKFLEGPLPHSQIPLILGCGDVYISFSSFDGIPNSLLEAMACGLVPIVADLPQLHEWIEHDLNGFIVPQHNTRALAALVKRLYEDRGRLAKMSSMCVTKIQEQGSYEKCMDRTRILLERIARIHGKR
jgi:glycosyltransferase involved in cell wall biosynthesis